MLVHLWSSPRNISTALMYSFAQRPDTKVIDEPLYAHYLLNQRTSAVHPGREEIIASQPDSEAGAVLSITNHRQRQGVVVCKQMTHHLTHFSRTSKVAMLDLEESAGSRLTRNVILLRNPKKILASFAKVVDKIVAEDIGLPQQYQLYRELISIGRLDAILDADRLLKNPAGTLEKLCQRLGIKYTDKMLSWPAGPISEDGVWAKHWYANVHKSTGFQPYVEQEVILSPDLELIAGEVVPLYEEMCLSDLVC